MTMEFPQEVLEDLSAPELRQWVTEDRTQIAGVLTSLRNAHVRTSIFFDRAPGSMVSMILDVSPKADALVFDTDADESRNTAITQAATLVWRTVLDGVRVEFTTPSPRWTEHAGVPAFTAPLPDVLLRLQRRNAFRAPAPIVQPLSVLVDARGNGRNEARLRVLDISALGMCLLVDGTVLPVVSGMRITRARFELPGYGEIRCALEVRYILSGGAKHPEHYRRCGVQFQSLASADEVLISRYINELQRERAKARG